MNLPMPEYGKTDKETIQILMDTTVKLRKELEYVLYHLDEQNIPMMKSVVGDISGAYTAIEQNEQQISLLATDLTGAKAQITVQAGQISSLVTTTNGQQSQITQNANSISTLVSTTQGQQTQINQTATSISLLSSTVDGHTAQISVQAGQISQKVSYNGVISAINQSAEQIDIEATRINLYGITNVNDVLQIGYTNTDAEIRFKNRYDGYDPYVRLYSGGDNLNVSCSTMSVNGNIYSSQGITAEGSCQINDYLVIQNDGGNALITYGNITAYGGDTNFNTNTFKVNGSKVALAMANQDLKFQVYGTTLEVYNGGSYAGKIKFD